MRSIQPSPETLGKLLASNHVLVFDLLGVSYYDSWRSKKHLVLKEVREKEKPDADHRRL